MDQCHISMCHMDGAWTSDVTYICAMGLKGLKSLTVGALQLAYFYFLINNRLYMEGISTVAVVYNS